MNYSILFLQELYLDVDFPCRGTFVITNKENGRVRWELKRGIPLILLYLYHSVRLFVWLIDIMHLLSNNVVQVYTSVTTWITGWLDDTQINGDPSVSLPFLRILVYFPLPLINFQALEKVKSWRNTSRYLTTKVSERGKEERSELFYDAEIKIRNETAGRARTARALSCFYISYIHMWYAIRGTTKVVWL